LAIVVDENVTAQELLEHVRDAAGPLLRRAIPFDIYRGPNVDSSRKSVGLGLILQDTSRTLTDEDAERTVQSVTLHLERELGATIRT
jgi:phenylalanyl-tRNA synthetase beta chain